MHHLHTIRFPLATALALLLTGALFSVLQSMTAVTFTPTVIETKEIKFTRVRVETPEKSRREIEKPVKPPIIELDDRLIVGPRDTVVGPPTVIVADKLTTDLPPVTTTNSGADTDVVPLVRVPPIYPNRELVRGTEGWVQLRFDITATGSVANASVVASAPTGVFDKAALDAIKRWRYNPKVQDGVAVERRGVETLLRFQIEQ